jgi:hypothetical protein
MRGLPPADTHHALLAVLDASGADAASAIGMSVKRLLEHCLSGETASREAMLAMAQEVLTEGRLTGRLRATHGLARGRGPAGGPDTVMMPGVPDRAGAATLLRCLAGNM